MEMTTHTVRIQSIEDARRLNSIVCSLPFDADLRQERYVLDARSFLGILSLNLSKPMFLDVYGDDGRLALALGEFIDQK